MVAGSVTRIPLALPSRITLTWRETRVAPASRDSRSSAATAPSTCVGVALGGIAERTDVDGVQPAARTTSRATTACAGASSRSNGSVVNSTLNRTPLNLRAVRPGHQKLPRSPLDSL